MKKRKKKFEWSKIFTSTVAIVFGIYGIWCGIEYYKLCKIAIENNTAMPDSTLAVTCVTTVLASLLSYCLYQGALKLSLNKNKLSIDKTTGIVKNITENGFLDTLAENTEEETTELDEGNES